MCLLWKEMPVYHTPLKVCPTSSVLNKAHSPWQMSQPQPFSMWHFVYAQCKDGHWRWAVTKTPRSSYLRHFCVFFVD